MLGKIYEQKGDTAKAIEHYEKLLDLWKDAEPSQTGQVDYYNNHRYHEAIDNITLHDRYLGLDRKILKQRKNTKAETIRLRRELYQNLSLKSLIESLY